MSSAKLFGTVALIILVYSSGDEAFSPSLYPSKMVSILIQLDLGANCMVLAMEVVAIRVTLRPLKLNVLIIGALGLCVLVLGKGRQEHGSVMFL